MKKLQSRLLVSVMALALGISGASPSLAQGGIGNSLDSRWLPWLGCWELDVERRGGAVEVPKDLMTCLSQNDAGDGVMITTLVDGAAVAETAFPADGVEHPVDEHGCLGWRSAEWSRDGKRLFLRSELTCESEQKRSVSGVTLLTPEDTWLDVQTVDSDYQRELVIRRYSRVDAREARNVGVPAPPRSTAVMVSARISARGKLSVADVMEAEQKLKREALEAMLVEVGEGFDIDARQLVQLADAGVSTGLLDLMVALSYPAHFKVDKPDPDAPLTGPRIPSGLGGLGGLGALGGLTPMSPYAAYYPFHLSPYSYRGGYGSSWHNPYSSYWRMGTPSSSDGGRSVSPSQGYTRITPRQPTSSGGYGAGGVGTGQGVSSGGGYSSDSSSSSSGGSGRTATPRE